eukprot:908034-Prorocentrum_minimum.AAC.3
MDSVKPEAARGDVIVVLGANGKKKAQLAKNLAQSFDGEVFDADLIEASTMNGFREVANPLLAETTSRGKTPVIVGNNITHVQVRIPLSYIPS